MHALAAQERGKLLSALEALSEEEANTAAKPATVEAWQSLAQ